MEPLNAHFVLAKSASPTIIGGRSVRLEEEDGAGSTIPPLGRLPVPFCVAYLGALRPEGAYTDVIVRLSGSNTCFRPVSNALTANTSAIEC